MLRRTFGFLCLAALGALCDKALHPIFCSQSARKIGQVGEGLTFAAASPDGKRVAGIRPAGSEQFALTIWETATGKVILGPQALTHPPATTNPLAWSPDGRHLAVGCSSEVNLFHLSDLSRQRLPAEWLIRDVRASQDLVMARADRALFVWRSDNGKLLTRLSQDHLLAAAFDAESGLIAAASYEDRIRLFSLAGKPLKTLPAGPATIRLDFVRKGRVLAAAFRFQSQRHRDYAVLHDLDSGDSQQMANPDLMGYSLSQDGKRMLTRSERFCRIWDGASGRLILEREMPVPEIDSLSADGQWVASLPWQGNQLVVWRSSSGQEMTRVDHGARPQKFHFFAPGMLQVTGGSCSVWQVNPGG